MFWKVYFWVIIVLVILGAQEGLVGLWDWVDLLVTSGGLVGLFAYAYKKRFFVAKVWKSYLPLLILWDLAYSLALKPEITGKAADMDTYVGFVFLVPIYAALYLYAFKFMEEPEPPRTGGPISRGAAAWVPGKWMYGLALLLFMVGGADYAAFTSIKYGANIGAGLSDSFALLGLTVWWGAAGGLAAAAFLRRRSSSQLAGVAPPAESTEAVALLAPESTVQTTPVKQENRTELDQQHDQIRPFIRIVAGGLGTLFFITLIGTAIFAPDQLNSRRQQATGGIFGALIFLYAAIKGRMPRWLAELQNKKGIFRK